jgi:pimeloyl-ACP methyl ester carboxylesterase
MWQPQLAQLPELHSLVPDLPRHGRSTGEGKFTIPGAAREVADLICSRAHGGRAHLVGLSLGAQVVVEILAQGQAPVETAVISGALVRPIPGRRLLNATIRMYAPLKDSDLLIRANMAGLGIPERYFQEFQADTRRVTATGLAEVTTANMTYGLPGGLASVQTPTLVVVGQRELWVMRQSARDLVKALPRAVGYVAPRLGHNWSLQAPTLFAATVRAFVARRELPQELLPLR